MQATTFVLWSSQHGAELLAVPCSGWRRPFALHVAAPDTFTVAVTRGDGIAIYKQWPAKVPGARVPPSRASCGQSNSQLVGDISIAQEQVGMSSTCIADQVMAGAALTLQAPYHGREVHAAACVQAADGACLAVTASEDGTVRCMMQRCVIAFICQQVVLLPYALSAPIAPGLEIVRYANILMLANFHAGHVRMAQRSACSSDNMQQALRCGA